MTAYLDFSPPTRERAAGSIGAYVAIEIAAGRAIFDVLGDQFVQDECDMHPFLLDELAADPAVRAALTMGPESVTAAVTLVAA